MATPAKTTAIARSATIATMATPAESTAIARSVTTATRAVRSRAGPWDVQELLLWVFFN